MSLKPKYRFVWPGDADKKVDITFALCELKVLQGLILRTMERAAEEDNAIYERHRELSKKIEYFIIELEGE